MDLNFGAAVTAIPLDDEKPDLHRLIAVMSQMQEGQNRLTDILVEHAARIAKLESENRMLKARTDAPKRAAIVFPGETKWPN